MCSSDLRFPLKRDIIYVTVLLVGMSARGGARGPRSLPPECTHAGSAAQP